MYRRDPRGYPNVLKDWARDADGAEVYWMNGMAGTGKTTILYSLCKWLSNSVETFSAPAMGLNKTAT